MEQPAVGKVHHDAVKAGAARLMGEFHAQRDDLFHVLGIHALDMTPLILGVARAQQGDVRTDHAAAAVDKFGKSLAVIGMNRPLQKVQIHVVEFFGVHVENAVVAAVFRNFHGQRYGREAATDDAGPVIDAESVDTAVVRAASGGADAHWSHHDTIVEHEFVSAAADGQRFKHAGIFFKICGLHGKSPYDVAVDDRGRELEKCGGASLCLCRGRIRRDGC